MGSCGFNDNGVGNRNLDYSRTSLNQYFEELSRFNERDSIVFKQLIKDESGNIESAMVLIPLVFLFLCSIQFVTAIQVRNFDQNEVQSQASSRAITGTFVESDSIINISSSNPFEDQKILIVSKLRDIPLLIPGLNRVLGGKLQSDVTGVAVIEDKP